MWLLLFYTLYPRWVQEKNGCHYLFLWFSIRVYLVQVDTHTDLETSCSNWTKKLERGGGFIDRKWHHCTTGSAKALVWCVLAHSKMRPVLCMLFGICLGFVSSTEIWLSSIHNTYSELIDPRGFCWNPNHTRLTCVQFIQPHLSHFLWCLIIVLTPISTILLL